MNVNQLENGSTERRAYAPKRLSHELAHLLPTREEARVKVTSFASNREGNAGSVRYPVVPDNILH